MTLATELAKEILSLEEHRNMLSESVSEATALVHQLKRKVEVYEAILRKLNVYGNLMVDHEKMRELMVALMNWQHSLRDGEHTQEEWEEGVQRAFEHLAKTAGV